MKVFFRTLFVVIVVLFHHAPTKEVRPASLLAFIPRTCPALPAHHRSTSSVAGAVCPLGDVKRINDIAVRAPCTGMLIVGGGLVKHHVCNANLMRNGADFAVFINTGTESRIENVFSSDLGFSRVCAIYLSTGDGRLETAKRGKPCVRFGGGNTGRKPCLNMPT